MISVEMPSFLVFSITYQLCLIPLVFLPILKRPFLLILALMERFWNNHPGKDIHKKGNMTLLESRLQLQLKVQFISPTSPKRFIIPSFLRERD